MLTNARRRELLDNVRRSGYPGSISEVFQAAQGGRDLVREFEMQQQQQQEMQVANTPEEQEVGLREEHAAGNTDASMAFPNVQPNQSFNTVGMQAPIDIQKIDNQGHLVESYKNVPPGIQDLPTGPAEGTIIESPAAYQKGGFNFKKKFDYSPEAIKERQAKGVDYENLELAASFAPYMGEVIDAKNTIQSLRKGKYGDAALHAAGFAIPFVPGGAIVRGYNKLRTKINPNVVTDVFGNVIKKKGAVRLNRIEDANITNKTFNKARPDGSIPYESGNWYSDQIEPFYLNKTKVAGTADELLPMDANRRVITGYLDPKDAEKFNVLQSTKEAISMSGGRGNLPIASEYVLPPDITKRLREKGKILKPKSALEELTNFYKKQGGFQYQKGGTKFSIGAEGNVNCLPGVAGCYGYESPLTLKPNFAFTYDTGRKHIGVQGGADLQTYFGGSDTREGAPVLAGGISGGIGTNPTSKELETSKHLSLIGKLGFKRRNLEGAHDWSSFNPGWDAGLYGKYDLLNKQLQDVGVYGSYGALEASLGYNPTQKMLQAGLGLRLGKRQTGGIKKYHEGGYSEHYGQNIDPDAPPHMYEPPHGTPQGDQDNMYTGSNPLYGGNLTDTGANAQYTNFNMLRHRGTHWEVPQWTGLLGNPTAGMSAQRIIRSASKGEEMYGPVGAVGGGIYGMAEPLVKNYATGYLGDVGKKYGKKAAKKFLPKAISRWFQKGGFLKTLTNPIRKNIAENLFPYTYNTQVGGKNRVIQSILGNKDESAMYEVEGGMSDLAHKNPAYLNERTDLLHLLMSQDQKYNTIKKSAYTPTKAKDKNVQYYTSPTTEQAIKRSLQTRGYDQIPTNNYVGMGGVLGRFKLHKGEDERGKYISYYDLWDLEPLNKVMSIKNQKRVGINPPEVYGRVYLDEVENVPAYSAKFESKKINKEQKGGLRKYKGYKQRMCKYGCM